MLNLLTGKGRDRKKIFRGLKKMGKERKMLHLEVEYLNIRFQSMVAVRRGSVVLGHPMGVKGAVKKGASLRFVLPGTKGREVRMKVTMPQFRLHNGSLAMLCEIPTEFIPQSRRSNKRYNTRFFSNISLVFPGRKKLLRIVDFSAEGCKVYTKDLDIMEALTIGVSEPDAVIIVGKQFRIHFRGMVPRMIGENQVGFEFRAPRDDLEEQKLNSLMESLEKSEQKKYRTAAIA